MNNNKTQKCSICGKSYKGYGNNAFPIDWGRCCNECNDKFVIPLRILMIENPVHIPEHTRSHSGSL